MERNISVWLPLTCPAVGTWPATQACAWTGNQTSDPLVHGPALKPLSHASQGCLTYFKKKTSNRLGAREYVTFHFYLIHKQAE